MSEAKYFLRLVVRHASEPASVIEAAIGEPAKTKWSRGDAREAPSGRELGGFREETYCSFRVPEAELMDVNGAIHSVVARLQSRKKEISPLTSSGGSVAFYLSFNQEVGQMLDASTIAAVASLDAGIGIDWSR